MDEKTKPASEVISDAERPHHPFSPSSLGLREECPCYESRGGSSLAAERGTLQHAAVEIGEDFADLEDHEALAVADCITFCEELERGKYGGRIGHILTEPHLVVDAKHIKVGGVKHKGTTAGYCDYVIVSKDETEADIVDWKFGMFEVTDAEFNIQGQSYLLGLKRRFPKLKRITVHFIAPHRDEMSFHTFEEEDFQGLYIRVCRAVQAAVEARNKTETGDFSDARPGFSACLFCKHITKCPPLIERMIEIGMKVNPLELPSDLNVEVVSDPKNAGIGLRLAGVVKGWAEGYRSFITTKTIDRLDYVPDGYTLVSSQRRSVVSVSGVKDLARQYGVVEEELDAASDIALGKVEAAIKSRAPRGTKGTAAQEFSRSCEEAGYVEKGAPFGFLKMSKGVKQ
jgi:hypothetical protein